MREEKTNHKTNIYALYLPQFYETEYNNRWWGKGYTEWVALKNARPLFPGHNQPRVPYGKDYYDLSRLDSIRRQVEIAREYGIDGFAIYQYYSCGSKLLDVPTEMFLNHPELELPFFLFWANTPWRKMWYGQEKTVLWEQNYGTEADWKKHFDYCMQFFKDSRYVRIDNRPVYGVYHAWEFPEIGKFIDCWNRWAKEAGFNGIYFLKAARIQDHGACGAFNAIVSREPDYTLAYDESFAQHVYRFLRTRCLEQLNKKLLMPAGRGIVMYRPSFDWVWKRIISRDYSAGNVIPGAFPDWDNSPRKGYNSYIVKGSTPEKFCRYFTALYQKANAQGAPFILINAWNEWAEGAYLEPDEKNGFAYLEGIRKAKTAPAGNDTDEN